MPSAEKAAARRELGLDEGPWVLFFGFIRAYKGLDVLLEALALVRRERPVRLLVAGEFYEGEERYRQQVAALGAHGQVAGKRAGDVQRLLSGMPPGKEIRA